jgi:hypothetical protein
MPSLLDPTLLRGQQPGDDPTGIQTLLAGIGSALSGGVAAPNDPNTSMASFLAAANTLANAGAPTLGPPPTTAQAILGALGNARGAAVQTGILPYLQERAQQQLESQQLDYQQKLFNFQRHYNYMNLLKQGVGASATDTGGAPAVPAPGAAPAAPSGDIASLADVQALPDATRVPFIQVAARIGMPPDEAANYARILMAESQGLHIDPKTNQVTKSSKGASGVAQVMPQTFLDMAGAHDDVTGSVADLMPNLLAGAHYFHDQVVANKGDLRNATIAYNAGPQNLTDYLAGNRTLPAETTDYLARVRPGGVQVADASGRVVGQPGAPPPPGGSGGSPDDPLVPDLLNPGLRVPRSVELAAQGAGRGAATDPMAAHAAVIKDYVEKRALQGNFAPTGVPGVQINRTTGQTEVAPAGVTSLSPITPAERTSMFPQIPSWQDIVVTRDPSGRITDYKLPEMGPEPIKPISDAQAQKPAEDGGAGASYRPGTAYGVGARTGLVKPIQIERGAGIPDATEGGAPTPGQLQKQQQVFQQTQELENQVVHSPVYTQWAQGAQRFDAVIASLNQHNRVGDQAAIESLAKVFDPSAVVTEGKLQMAASYGGVAQQLQNALGKITGESGLPDNVRQQIVDLATAEMKTRDAAVLGQIARSRASAKAKGLNPDNVVPLFQTTILGKGDAEARNAPKGVELAPPVRLENGQFVRGEPTERSGTVPVSTPERLGGMSPQGLAALVNDIKTNPRYGSQEQRQLHLDAVQAEINRRPKGQPPAGGGG